MLSLEGLSLEFADQAAKSGLMPHLGDILSRGALVRVQAALPTVGSVTWAGYATGAGPGKHGVFGFVDRTPNPFQVHIPNAQDLRLPAIWQVLSRNGKQVGVMNLPLTYPPQRVNGFMVSCSLAPELAKGTYPVELAPRLMELDYRIEANTRLASQDMGAFLEDLERTMSARFSACLELMRTESWDFFQLHLSSCDLINYFLWSDDLQGEESFRQEYQAFYRKLDSYLGELFHTLPDGCRLAVVSGNGFTRTKAVVYLNRWLEENGYLHFARGKRSLVEMHPESRAYSLVPGRVYLNLKGREERGSVERGKAYEELREELIHRLGGLSHPENGEPLVGRIHRREDLYAGPQLKLAPDLIIEPAPGYELKASLDGPAVLGPPQLPGMHLGSGGFFFLEGAKSLQAQGPVSLADVAPTLLELLDVAPPPEVDGRSLL